MATRITKAALEEQVANLEARLIAADELAEQRKVLLEAAEARIAKAVEIYRQMEAKIQELSAKRQAPQSKAPQWVPGTIAREYRRADGSLWGKKRTTTVGLYTHVCIEPAPEAATA